jgi:hypothetical protein
MVVFPVEPWGLVTAISCGSVLLDWFFAA